MTNVLYPKFKEALGLAQINLLADTVKAMLVDGADYTYNAAHRYLSDVPVGAREETSAALTGKTWVDGVFDADDVSFPAATGDPVEAVILFKDTGSAATSPLLVYIDAATNLPLILNGGGVTVTWPSGESRIFSL